MSPKSSNSTYIPWLEFFKQENWYYDLFTKYGDPRTKDLFMLQTPEPMLVIVLLYLAFVVLVPRLMQHRPPMDLKNLIVVYNFSLVALSGYMCFEFFYVATSLGYSYSCQPVDWEYSRDPLNMRMISVSWLFFFSKIIELADTVFFILRKKDNQVTFLHVYHHATMIINWWMAAKYIPIGQSFFVGVVNSFVHTLMYVYYALAALGPQMQKYLWWKKYMTKLQLVQFVLVVSHTGNNMFIRTDCDYPWLYNNITFYYTWSMMFLFLNFYYRTYISKRKTEGEKLGKASKTVGTKDENGYLKEINNNVHSVRSRKHNTNGFSK